MNNPIENSTNQINESNKLPEQKPSPSAEIQACLDLIRRGILQINGYNNRRNTAPELEAYYLYCREQKICPRCQSQFSTNKFGSLSCSCAGYEGP